MTDSVVLMQGSHTGMSCGPLLILDLTGGPSSTKRNKNTPKNIYNNVAFCLFAFNFRYFITRQNCKQFFPSFLNN